MQNYETAYRVNYTLSQMYSIYLNMYPLIKDPKWWKGKFSRLHWVCVIVQIVLALKVVMKSLKRMCLALKEKGRVVLLGDFNARVGKSVEMDDVIGMFGGYM